MRKWFWTVSSIVEGVCVLAMGLVGLFGIRGAAAGWAIVALLVRFSAARGVASIASKDTLGKTVPKGLRGRVSGYAATLSGVVASLVGLWLVLVPQAARPQWLLYAIIVAAGHRVVRRGGGLRARARTARRDRAGGPRPCRPRCATRSACSPATGNSGNSFLRAA